jgi:hypothetical protein
MPAAHHALTILGKVAATIAVRIAAAVAVIAISAVAVIIGVWLLMVPGAPSAATGPAIVIIVVMMFVPAIVSAIVMVLIATAAVMTPLVRPRFDWHRHHPDPDDC